MHIFSVYLYVLGMIVGSWVNILSFCEARNSFLLVALRIEPVTSWSDSFCVTQCVQSVTVFSV